MSATWAVSVTMVAPGDADRAAFEPDAVGRFADLLEVHHGAGGFDTRRLDATISVPAESAVAAARRGAPIVADAAERCGLSHWAITAVEALDADELDRRHAIPQVPDIVGTRELMNLLGITRQRLAALRRQPTFPSPFAELAATPVWDKAAIDAWVEQWDRRSGRPRRRPERPVEATAGHASQHH